MTLEAPITANYAAMVIRVEHIERVPNTDRLQVIHHYGMNAIVGLEVKEGDLGLLFPAECQLSFDYCYWNNLHSHSTKEYMDGHEKKVLELNHDTSAKGYFGDNRRVRAITLQKVKSDALFMPINSLHRIAADGKDSFDPKPFEDLVEGATFDHFCGKEICRKYVIATKGGAMSAGALKIPSRVDARVFPEHFESTHYARVDRNLDPNHFAYVTQKLHGTSIRIGYVPVRREPTRFEAFLTKWKQRLPRFLGDKIYFFPTEFEYDMVYGSHHAIKDANNPRAIHFYGSDVWSEYGHSLDGILPKNIIVYGELIGWYTNKDGGVSAIQKHYTYDVPYGQNRMYVYRVVMVNDDGAVIDLSWNQVVAFCEQYGLLPVPELWRGYVWQLQDRQVPDMGEAGPTFLETNFLERKFKEDGWHKALELSGDSICDEGVCIRIEDNVIQPVIVKAKSPSFVQKETIWLDEGKADLESSEGAETDEEAVLV